MKHKRILIPYSVLNVYQQYWEGQGDPLYAVLSRRGISVDWVTVDVSFAELQRLQDLTAELCASKDPKERRVAQHFAKILPAKKHDYLD